MSLTSYRAAPPRDKNIRHWDKPGGPFDSLALRLTWRAASSFAEASDDMPPRDIFYISIGPDARLFCAPFHFALAGCFILR